MICVIKNSKVFAIHSDNQVAEIRNKYDGLDIIHIADDANVTLGSTDPRDLGATWKDARFLLNSLELDSPFRIKSAFYTSGTDTLSIVIASGTGETFNNTTINTITKTTDTTLNIPSPLASTTYTIYLKNDGNFDKSTDGTTVTGSITIGIVSTNMDKTVNTIVDKRPLVSGVGEEFRRHEADNVQHIGYATASGTNTYTVSIAGINALEEGLSVKIKFTNANTGAATLNINSLGAKAIQKSNGSALSSGNIKAGQIVHLVYSGLFFQLLGEGGEYGTAGAAQVLAGYTIGTENGLIEGSIPSKGAATITPGSTNQVIAAAQYLSGAQTIKGDANLVAGNIKIGTSIFGVGGNLEVKKHATGTVASDNWQNLTVSGLAFQPTVIIIYSGNTADGEIKYYHPSVLKDWRMLSILNSGAIAIHQDWTVSYNSFTTQVHHENRSYTWIAIG